MSRYRYTGTSYKTYTSYREVYEDKDNDGQLNQRALVGDPENDEYLTIEPVLGDRDEVAGNNKVVTIPGDPVPPNDGLWEEEPEKKKAGKTAKDKDGE